MRCVAALCAALAARASPPADREHCLLARRSISHLSNDRRGDAGDDTCTDYMRSVGCGWTSDWNCPRQIGGIGMASDDHSLGYTCCCTRGLWESERVSVAAKAVATEVVVTGAEVCEAAICDCEQPQGVCMLWGDPHIYVFDGKRHIRVLENGNYFVVRSSCVSIQARYGPGGPNGDSPSVIHALAVGGSFLEGHVLEVEAGGEVTWDGQPILETFPSSFDVEGLVRSRFSGDSEHIDPGLRGVEVRSIDAVLPSGVRLTVNRWPHHLDVLLAMRPLPGGQDGHCGNFNGNSSDDSAELIMHRMGAQIQEEDLLLSAQDGLVPMQTARSLADCALEVREMAEAQCRSAVPPNRSEAVVADFIESCTLDVCFGGEQFAREDAVIEEQMEHRANLSLSGECSCPTPAPPPAPRRHTCIIHGDPHIITFDTADEHMAGRNLSIEELWKLSTKNMITLREGKCKHYCGDHWLVKSDDIKIQVRYSEHNTWVEGLAVSGPFLENHRLVVSNLGEASWDGVQVDSFPSSFSNEFVRLLYIANDSEALSTGWRERNGVISGTMRIDLPQHVTLRVNVVHIPRKNLRFLDVFITMAKPAGGLDGHCGNADGDTSYETQLKKRVRQGLHRVRDQESFFSRQLLLVADSAEPVTDGSDLPNGEERDVNCTEGTWQEAWSLCNLTLPEGSSAEWVDACADDVCAGGQELAKHSVMLAALAEDTMLKEVMQAAASENKAPAPAAECRTCTPQDGCFDDVKWAMEFGIPTGWYARRDLFPTIDSSSCFEEIQAALGDWQRIQAALEDWQRNPDFDVGAMSDGAMPVPCDGLVWRHQKNGLTYCR